jgi:cell division protein FtsZ
MPEVRPPVETFAKIKVIGVGGSGGSAVNRMIKSKIKGVEFISANTDVQALAGSAAGQKITIGKTATRGLGAGMDPEKGRIAAEESINELREALKGADMVFVTCGMGGGTGTGAAPIIADIAREQGALTIAVVTKPFTWEGRQRQDIAERGYAELAGRVDAIISIPNDRVLQVIDRKASIIDAFETIDDVLRQGVQGISEIITVPGLINVDFADVKAIMNETGSALMGIGKATGENRATEAAKQAVASPLLDVSIEGAKGILFTITGGTSLGMHEIAEAAKVITASADPNARVIFGATIDENLKDDVKVCVIATGFDSDRRFVAKKEVKAEPTYTPNQFLRKEATAVKAPEAAAPAPTPATAPEPSSLFTRKPLLSAVRDAVSEQQPAAAPAPMPAPTPTISAEEDLEVPAFLRRKPSNQQ